MIIHKPEITEEGDEVCISARVEIQSAGLELPDTLWFRYAKRHRNVVTDRADGFLVGLLPSAMALGEDIIVEGPVSPVLAYGIREYQNAQHAWWPDRLAVVETTFHELSKPDKTEGTGVGCTLSGGVDSFYTLWKHLPHNEALENYRLTHTLMINGFDFDDDVEQTGSFERTRAEFEPLIEQLGLEPVVSRNNLRRFRLAAQRRAPLFLTLAAPIAASVLVLGNLFARFYIAGSGSYTYESLYPKGAHPVITHYLGTENVQIIVDGYDASRVDKTSAIARWPVTYSRLRVCWRETQFNERTGLIENCGRCDKCVRTMVALDLLGALSKYKTFPRGVRRRDIWGGAYISRPARVFAADVLRLAQQVGRRDRAFDIRLARFRSRVVAFGARVRRRLIGGWLR